MQSTSRPGIVWRRKIETVAAGAQPRLLVQDVDGDGHAELLLGVRRLHVLDELGNGRWTRDLDGCLAGLAVGHRDGCYRLVAVATGREYDLVASSANAISSLCCEGCLCLVSPAGEDLGSISLDEAASAIAFLNCEAQDRDEIFVGTRGFGPDGHTSGSVMMLTPAGGVAWRFAAPSAISILVARDAGTGGPHLFAGTEHGELLALSRSGELAWRQAAGRDRVASIQITAMAAHEPRVAVGLSDGTSALYSAHGDLLWRHHERSPLVGLCAAGTDGNGEPRLIVGYADAVRCYGQDGGAVWVLPVATRLLSLAVLEHPAQGVHVLACTGSSGIVVRGRDGSIAADVPLGGRGLSCTAANSPAAPGWAVCVARPPANLLSRLVGWRDLELVLLGS